MNLSRMTIDQRITQAVRDFEQRHTDQEREWVALFLNEETVVIAVHGSLTEQESTLAGDPAGYALVLDSQKRLLINTVLLQRIECICGMRVLDTQVDLEPTIGGVVLLFTTDTAGKDFPLYPGHIARSHTPGRGSLERSEGGSRRATRTTRCVIRV